jgi:ABC-type nitrate/sulfonate/bicarbonate transport system permease component
VPADRVAFHRHQHVAEVGVQLEALTDIDRPVELDRIARIIAVLGIEQVIAQEVDALASLQVDNPQDVARRDLVRVVPPRWNHTMSSTSPVTRSALASLRSPTLALISASRKSASARLSSDSFRAWAARCSSVMFSPSNRIPDIAASPLSALDFGLDAPSSYSIA